MIAEVLALDIKSQEFFQKEQTVKINLKNLFLEKNIKNCSIFLSTN